MKSPEKENYEYLHDLYPPIIHLEQFREICHISKRKGSWILQNGVVPCQDSGKQTRRFKIKLDDVIQFLKDRDAGLVQDKIPIGIFRNGSMYRVRPVFAPVDPEYFTSFLEQKWQAEPDALTTEQAAMVADCAHRTILKWIARNHLTAIERISNFERKPDPILY